MCYSAYVTGHSLPLATMPRGTTRSQKPKASQSQPAPTQRFQKQRRASTPVEGRAGSEWDPGRLHAVLERQREHRSALAGFEEPVEEQARPPRQALERHVAVRRQEPRRHTARTPAEGAQTAAEAAVAAAEDARIAAAAEGHE